MSVNNNEMNHIEENRLELFILGSEQIAEERSMIENHLASCEGCAALFKEIKNYYADIAEIQHQREKVDALQVYKSIVPYNDRQIYQTEHLKLAPLILRIYHSIMKRPILAYTGAASILIMLVLLFLPKPHIKDYNPGYARAVGEDLVVFNKDDEELWRKHIGYRDDLDFITERYRLENWVKLIDVDADGRNEILHVLSPPPAFRSGNEVICYNSNGTDRWRYIFDKNIPPQSKKEDESYKPRVMAVNDYYHDGTVDVIVVTFSTSDSVCIIFRLDGATGKFMGSYIHPGTIFPIDYDDIDRDGKDEFIFTAFNNSYNSAALGILDPKMISGQAPTLLSSTDNDSPIGYEKYYILLPNTDVRTTKLKYELILGKLETPSVRGDSKLMAVKVIDKVLNDEFLTLTYLFDSTMQCVNILPSKQFIDFHKKMEKEGKLKVEYNDHYLEQLRSDIRYWDGKNFIESPIKNKNHSD